MFVLLSFHPPWSCSLRKAEGEPPMPQSTRDGSPAAPHRLTRVSLGLRGPSAARCCSKSQGAAGTALMQWGERAKASSLPGRSAWGAGSQWGGSAASPPSLCGCPPGRAPPPAGSRSAGAAAGAGSASPHAPGSARAWRSPGRPCSRAQSWRSAPRTGLREPRSAPGAGTLGNPRPRFGWSRRPLPAWPWGCGTRCPLCGGGSRPRWPRGWSRRAGAAGACPWWPESRRGRGRKGPSSRTGEPWRAGWRRRGRIGSGTLAPAAPHTCGEGSAEPWWNGEKTLSGQPGCRRRGGVTVWASATKLWWTQDLTLHAHPQGSMWRAAGVRAALPVRAAPRWGSSWRLQGHPGVPAVIQMGMRAWGRGEGNSLLVAWQFGVGRSCAEGLGPLGVHYGILQGCGDAFPVDGDAFPGERGGLPALLRARSWGSGTHWDGWSFPGYGVSFPWF